MSEQILKALMQLFAIVSKQDDGTNETHRQFVKSFLMFQLSTEKVDEYLNLYNDFLYDKKEKVKEYSEGNNGPKRTSVRDSVKTMGICLKINNTLSHKQKIVVFARLLELLKKERQFTLQRIELIDTVSTVFNISNNDRLLINHFIVNDDPYAFHSNDLLVIDADDTAGNLFKHIKSEGLAGKIVIVNIKSADLYFAKYNGNSQLTINGLNFAPHDIYILAPGSNLRLPKGTLYFSDIVSHFLRVTDVENISFHVKNLSYKFSNGNNGIHAINLVETLGNLVAIMGASGSGKTTLLNLLSGLEKPSQGTIEINGFDLNSQSEKLEGLIGYIAQDDLLIEELTVYENLFYYAKLCFSNLSDYEIQRRVEKQLNTLGLFEVKDIVVGSPLIKRISGGQRKRLNIALELIREPLILFVDEPTSGLSSADSENVMDLLKELTVKGKLIFVVIHQPSSDVYKMFDKLILLDVGGYPIYYGNPIEAVTYFKKHTNQIKAEVGECYACGNVNPEQLFSLVESKVVNEFGQFQAERKIKPIEWNEKYRADEKTIVIENKGTLPKKSFHIPSKIKQFAVFLKRDLVSKIANKQYIVINLLEAPLLALILSSIIRYIGKPEAGIYKFRENENIPAYIFVCIIISMFIGLTVSAEEIFKDRKLLKQQKLLSLSKLSYLFSKIVLLFSLSAIQMLLFVWVGNSIVGIREMAFDYWLVLFSVSCFSNILGLIISATFNSAVTIYILIPLLVIPQMILGGAMFNYDKINELFGGGPGKKTPIIADLMVSRWAFEGLAVQQFSTNKYEQPLFELNKMESVCAYKQSYYLPKLQEIVLNLKTDLLTPDSLENTYSSNIRTLKNELIKEMKKVNSIPFDYIHEMDERLFSLETVVHIEKYIDQLIEFYSKGYNTVHKEKEVVLLSYKAAKNINQQEGFIYDNYYNEALSDLVRKKLVKSPILQINENIVQVIDPIYKQAVTDNKWNFRTHFFAPQKYIFNAYYKTFNFNLVVIWSFTLILFFVLYFDLLKKATSLFNGIFIKSIHIFKFKH